MAWAAEQLGPDHPIAYVAFNREEDGLLGSEDFVRHGRARLDLDVSFAHVLEMLGFTSERQELPPGLPIPPLADGRFLGLLAKQGSNNELRRIAELAARAGVPAIGLQSWLGVDQLVPDLHRSDHAPFWRAGVPALLWTDTAEFRNPHYHRRSDTPATLDYPFLARVAGVLAAALVGV